MYPYHLLPKADDRQAPDEERKRAYDPLSSIRVRQPKPKRRNPTVPLVVYTAFGVREAEQLRKRLENTPRPVDLRPQSQYNPSDPHSSIQAPSSKHASEHPQNSRQIRDISNAVAGSDNPKDKEYDPPVASEPSLPDIAPDVAEESETNAFSAEKAWSYEDLFLSMDAVDLSYYSSLQEYELVREAAICLRHEKLILHYLDTPREFLKHFATYTWDEEADGAAEEFTQWYIDRFRKELEEQRDIAWSGLAFGEAEDTIKRWQKDLTNDERERVIAIDLQTGETLFVRYGDEDSVTLHDEQKKLVEDRYNALLHHHPNNSAASLADIDAADWLKAEILLIANRDGTLHRYARVGDALIPLEPTRNPEYAAESDPLETRLADMAYLLQTWSEIGNPPEMVMRQGEMIPKLADYFYNAQSKQSDSADIERSLV